MPDIQNYFSFISAVVLFQLIPGAGTIAILNAAATGGVGSGMRAVCGTLTGDFIYMLAAVLGLAALLEAYPCILNSAQWLGAAYLCWTGLKLWRKPLPKEPAEAAVIPGNWSHFRQALAVSLTNPKVIVFFIAFFPLFLTAQSTPLTLLVLMGHVTTISFVYQAALVLMGSVVARRISRWRLVRLAALRVAGVGLIGFGLRLAFDNR